MQSLENTIGETSTKEIHQNRSTIWVEILAKQLRKLYAFNKDIWIFSKHFSENRAAFGLNELLYHVTVCEVGIVKSSVHGKRLHYVKSVLWQIESEMARDSREALYDFNKLVLGSGLNKLFIGPIVHDPKAFIELLLPAAIASGGNNFVALIPHPSEWDSSIGHVFLWRLTENKWRAQETIIAGE